MNILSRLVGTTPTGGGNNNNATRSAAERLEEAAAEAEARLPLRSASAQDEQEEDDSYDDYYDEGGWLYSNNSNKMMLQLKKAKSLQNLATDTSVFQSIHDVGETATADTASSSQQSPCRSVGSHNSAASVSSSSSCYSTTSSEMSLLPPAPSVGNDNVHHDDTPHNNKDDDGELKLAPPCTKFTPTTTPPRRSSRSVVSIQEEEDEQHIPEAAAVESSCGKMTSSTTTTTSYLQLIVASDNKDNNKNNNDDVFGCLLLGQNGAFPPLTPATITMTTTPGGDDGGSSIFTVETMEEEPPSFLLSTPAAAARQQRATTTTYSVISPMNMLLLDTINNSNNNASTDSSSSSSSGMENNDDDSAARLLSLAYSSPSFQQLPLNMNNNYTSSYSSAAALDHVVQEESSSSTPCKEQKKRAVSTTNEKECCTALIPFSPLLAKTTTTSISSYSQPPADVTPTTTTCKVAAAAEQLSLAQESPTIALLDALSASSCNHHGSSLVHHHHEYYYGPTTPLAKQQVNSVHQQQHPSQDAAASTLLLNRSFESNNSEDSIVTVPFGNHEEPTPHQQKDGSSLAAEDYYISPMQDDDDFELAKELAVTNHAERSHEEVVEQQPDDDDDKSLLLASSLAVDLQEIQKEEDNASSGLSLPEQQHAAPMHVVDEMIVKQQPTLVTTLIAGDNTVPTTSPLQVESLEDKTLSTFTVIGQASLENTLLLELHHGENAVSATTTTKAATLDLWMESGLNNISLDSSSSSSLQPSLSPLRQQRSQSCSPPRTKKHASSNSVLKTSSSCPSSPPDRRREMAAATADLDCCWLGSGLMWGNSVSFQPSVSFAHDEGKGSEILSLVDRAIEPQRCNSAPTSLDVSSQSTSLDASSQSTSLDASSQSSNEVSLVSSSSMPLTKEKTSAQLVIPLERLYQQHELAKALDSWIGSESSILSSSRDTTDDGSPSPPRLQKFAVDSVQTLNSLEITSVESPPRPCSATSQANNTLPSPANPSSSQRLTATHKLPPTLHEMFLNSSISRESLPVLAAAQISQETREFDSMMMIPNLNSSSSSSLNSTSSYAHELPVYDSPSSCFKLKIVGVLDSSSTSGLHQAPMDSCITDDECAVALLPPTTSSSLEIPQSTSLTSLQGFLTTVSEESEQSNSSRDTSMEHDSNSSHDNSSSLVDAALPKDLYPTTPPSKQSQETSLDTRDIENTRSGDATTGLETPERDTSRELFFTPSVVDPEGISFAEDGSVKIDSAEDCEERAAATWISTAADERMDSSELDYNDENAKPLCENHNESSPQREQDIDDETTRKPLSRCKSNMESLAIDMAALDWASLTITGRVDKEQTCSTSYQVVELDDVSSLGESISASPTKYLIPAMMVRQHHMATTGGKSESIPHPGGTLERTATIYTSESTRETESKILRASATTPSDIESDSSSVSKGPKQYYFGYIQRSPPHIKIALFGSLLLLVAAAFLLGVAVKAENSSLRGSTDRTVADVQSQVSSNPGPSMEMRISPPAASPISANVPTTTTRSETQQPETMNTTETHAEQQSSVIPTRSDTQQQDTVVEEQAAHSDTQHESLPAKELPLTQPWDFTTPSVAPSVAPSLPPVLSVEVPTAADNPEKELSWFYMGVSSPTAMPTFRRLRTDDPDLSGKMAKSKYQRRKRFMQG